MRTFASILAAIALCGAAACDRRPARPRAVPISIGDTVSGRLDRDDWTDVFADGSYTDLYEIRLRSGQAITVEMSSRSLDTYLSLLRGPGDQIIDNDDIGGGNTNSRFTYRAATDMKAYIAATTFRPGQTGSYTLRVHGGDASVTKSPSRPEAGGDGGPARGDAASPPTKTAPAAAAD